MPKGDARMTTTPAPGAVPLLPTAPPFWKLKTVPLGLVHDALSPGPAPDAAFCASVATYGVLQPIIVRRADVGYYVVAGRRRVAAARAAHFEEIPAFVLEAGQTSPHLLAIIENSQRSDNIYSDYTAIQVLLEEHETTEEEIAQATHLTIAQIRAKTVLRRLPLVLRMALGKGAISSSVALAVAKLAPDLQAECVALYVANGKLAAKEVHALRAALRSAQVAALPAALFADEELDEDPGAEAPDDGKGWAREAAMHAERLRALLEHNHVWVGPYLPDLVAKLQDILDGKDDA